ncbi:hypothetical protein DNH61_25830 [Paenibacillus sambharensis]|uniref:Lipoprotein n=1 Tax=Paenibacillus sambharensis TaxID=1803190 RepID=A0A2W1KZ37_9BACL|nr:hypothetical protein [Paenibacillus sambharensis]PZD92918.1 hypothetical protein DNH61_25830 [Paenibacillus sambharensis]
MNLQKKLIIPLTALLMSLPTACSNDVPLPSQTSLTETSQTNVNRNEDKAVLTDPSIRAVGTHPEGRLLIRSTEKTSAAPAPLGAASCYGLETDLKWSGTHQVVWESAVDDSTSPVVSFNKGLEIIQPDDTPIELPQYAFGDTVIYIFTPRYTDCHGLEFLLFGVQNNEAFPVMFEFDGLIRANFYRLPSKPVEATEEGIVVTGGLAAGQDYMEIYHFEYDETERTMVLKKTERLPAGEVR